MDENYLQKGFIDEVRGALNRGGGGSASFDPSKHKLSDFENDLWYKKTETVITLKPEDFTYFESDDNSFWYYKGTPAFDWLIDASCISMDVIWDGETYTHEGKHGGDDGKYLYYGGWSNDNGDVIGYWYYCDDCGIQVVTGVNIFNNTEEDSFYVQVWTDGSDYPPSFDSVTIYKLDEKKVPIEYCDTSDIESEIDALAKEVNQL